jgi:hypothetical protein
MQPPAAGSILDFVASARVLLRFLSSARSGKKYVRQTRADAQTITLLNARANAPLKANPMLVAFNLKIISSALFLADSSAVP